MRILLDPQIYYQQKYGGISRYYTEIYIALKKMRGVEIECPVVFSENLHLKEHSLFTSFRNKILLSKIFKRKGRARNLQRLKDKNVERIQKALKKQDFDLFVPTYYDPYFLEDLGDKPFVITVYDMIHELFPHYFTNDPHTAKRKKILFPKAAKIIAISESTKKDIIRFYPEIDASKIEVVYLAHSITRDATVNLSLPEKYLLFVGNRDIYKNFTFFINAVAEILKERSNLFLVCAGGNAFTVDEDELIQKLGLSGKILQRNFEDYELATFYSNAECFVFPSQYEGFGIPVLESMACGCPVVLANHSSFPEVAGDAGIYFNLDDATDLKCKILELLENKVIRAEYISKGLQQASKFSWEKTANDCLKIFRSAVNVG